MCTWLCFYFLSLFYVLFVARAFSCFLFARACIIVMYIQLTLDAYFILTVVFFIFLAYTNVCSVTELTLWVAPPKMVYNWYRI